nr:rust resistance kinase Lr10-like [Ipomoea batatas]
MKGYFLLHLPILVLLLTLIMTLGHGCLPRRCGNNGPEISFPFRLKNIQPHDCGYPGFDLLCTEMGETVLELPFPLLNGTHLPYPVKFFIDNIYYEYDEIVISPVDGHLLQLLPLLNLSASPFSFPQYLNRYSIFNCSSNRTNEKTHLFPITCLSKQPHHFVYAVGSILDLYSVTDLMSCTKTFEISASYKLIQYCQFLLKWTRPSCGLKNNSTQEDAYCNGKGPSTGLLGKLKVAGEVFDSFLAVLLVLAAYLIYRSKKMKEEEQMLEAEEPASMPPNPFGSTDSSKTKVSKPVKLFTSGLEIISELE